MKKLISYILSSICIILILSMSAFAESDLFYYDRSNPMIEQAINDEEVLNELRFQATLCLPNFSFGEVETLDKSKVSFDFDKMVLLYHFDSDDFIPFINSKDKKAFLNNIFEADKSDTIRACFPCYYDGVRTSCISKLEYDSNKNRMESAGLYSLGEYEATYYDYDALSAYISEKTKTNCKPLVILCGTNTMVAITEINNEYVAVYLPDPPEGTPNRIAEAHHARMMKKPYYSIDELVKNIQLRDAEMAKEIEFHKNNPNLYGGANSTMGQSWIWIAIGGAVVLIGGLVTVLLIVKKRQKG